jgi:hypothetical protein
MGKSRKFKKKLAPKVTRTKNEPVLSVNIIGKEYFKRVKELVLRLMAFTKLKTATKN